MPQRGLAVSFVALFRNVNDSFTPEMCDVVQVCKTCCYLRAKIRHFEESFFLREGHLPSPDDRELIQGMQAQYRDLKKGARDFAATKIQVQTHLGGATV